MEIKQAFSEKYQKLISLPNLNKAQKFISYKNIQGTQLGIKKSQTWHM